MTTFRSIVLSGNISDAQRCGNTTIIEYHNGTDIEGVVERIERNGYTAWIVGSRQVESNALNLSTTLVHDDLEEDEDYLSPLLNNKPIQQTYHQR